MAYFPESPTGVRRVSQPAIGLAFKAKAVAAAAAKGLSFVRDIPATSSIEPEAFGPIEYNEILFDWLNGRFLE
jgi:hypothetical protein